LAALKHFRITPCEATEQAAFLESMATENKDTNVDAPTNGDGTENLADDFVATTLEGNEEEVTEEEDFSPTPSRILRTPPRSAGRSSANGRSPANPTPPRTLPVRAGDGTKKNPFVLMHDMSHPERNHPFTIKFQPSVVHEGFEHKCLDIEQTVDPLDMDEWEATVPFPAVQGLAKRVVDVKGPSLSFQFRNQDEEETDTEHLALLRELEITPSRKHLHWRIIFPANLLINNDILSKGRFLKKGHLPLSIKKNHPLNECDKDFHVTLLRWRIAVEGGSREMGTQEKVDKRSFFK
jgi:hypothetical protein